MISLIVAVDENYLIGMNNDLPWRCKDDLKNFKETTMGCPIIMGRKTYESLPKVLPGREHFVVTSGILDVPEEAEDRVHRCTNLMDAINGALACAEPKSNLAKSGDSEYEIYEEEVFVIGGETLYHDVMEQDLIDRVIMSRMRLAVDPNDTAKYFFFEQWKHKFTLSFEEDFPEFVRQTWDRDPEKQWVE